MLKEEAKTGFQRIWSNFKQALYEVFAAETMAASKVEASYGVKVRGKDKASELVGGDMDTALITESTKIIGSIVTDSNIAIAGEVQGDVESRNTVIALGKVLGNIRCKDAEINEAYIEGNIIAVELVTVGTGSVIIGDVSANDGVVAGKIKGNIDAKSDVQISKDAIILGDISASSINVERGAIIQGSVKIRSDEVKHDSFDFAKSKTVFPAEENKESNPTGEESL